MKKVIGEIIPFKYLWVSLLFIALVSCEGNTDTEWLISNQSASEILVQAYSSTYGDSLNTTIQANSSKLVFFTSSRGGNPNVLSTINIYSYFEITNTEGDTLMKPYESNNSWIPNVNQVSKIPSQYTHTYTFRVQNTDF